MAEIIDKNMKIKMGNMVRVRNTQKKFNENDLYVSIQVEDEDGNNERCLLFTEIEISDMEKIKCQFMSDNMKAGRLYKANINGFDTNLVKVVHRDGREMIFRLSNSQLESADFRSLRNPEDLTVKGFIEDLKD